MFYKTVVINVFFLFLMPFLTESSLKAQKLSALKSSKNHRKLVRLSERMIKDGYFVEAATLLEDAYHLKPKKKELAYQSALLYFNNREYRKAVNLFQLISNNKKFPNIHFEYAQALQQAGNWDEAIPEFLIYLNNYNGKDREQVSEKIEEYINGCSLAIRQSDSTKASNVLVEHLNENINTHENDIAPVPFGEDILYFTTRWKDAAKILRTQQVGHEWAPAQPLKSLPIVAATPIGNGAFSPDGTRFYCTICEEIGKKKKKSCGIFVLKQTKDGWSAPIKLSERINTNQDQEGMTTQPFVMHKGNNEILFFTSNRKGGRGGMDIWMSSRTRSDDNSDFDSPMNLGAIINTEGDEVTPFYDEQEQALYFASNGRATMGGLDIFRSQGSGQRWTSPANLGVPYNSGADDWYFVKNKSETSGFFASNRAFGMEKFSSEDDDIFSFTVNNKRELLVSGNVFEKNTKSLLENVRLSLYEQRAEGDTDLRLLSSIICAEGSYQFAILPQKIYTLEVEKDGFRLGNAVFSTKDSLKNGTRNFYLERYILGTLNKITTQNDSLMADSVSHKNTNTEIASLNQSKNIDPQTVINIKSVENKSKLTNDNRTFKIQVLAYETELDNVSIKKLKRLENLGDFETEEISIHDKCFTRILIPFQTYPEAVAALRKVKEKSFYDAFIIRYENGKRMNKNR